MSNEMELLAKKHALKNARDYGSANPKAVVGKLFAESNEAKENRALAMQIVEKACADVNSMPKEKIEEELATFSFEKKEQDMRLLKATGKVITRFQPEPSAYLHIGHAKAIFLQYQCAAENNGEMLLRVDDTNPKNEKQEFLDAIKEDMSWLGVKWGKELYTSDSMEFLYSKARELFEKNKLYVTKASQEELKKSRDSSVPLTERNASVEENLELFDQMLENNFDEGQIAVIWKGDLEAPNTTLRDPAMFRIVKHPHYRQGEKYIVWPSYDFVAPILDSYFGVTHAMRSKEYELRTQLYFDILTALDMRAPELIHFSRLKLEGAIVSKRYIKPLIEQNLVDGWDDPRLPTLRGIRRRGIHPKAIRNFALSFGLGKQEKVVDFESLYKENRRVLDETARRIFFIKNPVQINIGIQKEISIPLHPVLNLGERTLHVENALYMDKEDLEQLQEKCVKLKQIGNFVISKGKEALPTEEKEQKIIQWVPKESAVPATLIIPKDLFIGEQFNDKSLEKISGLAEPYAKTLKKGEIVQLERVGFAIVDKTDPLEFILSC